MMTNYYEQTSKVSASTEKLEAIFRNKKTLAISSLYVDASYEDRMSKKKLDVHIRNLRDEKIALQFLEQGYLGDMVTDTVTSVLEPTVDKFSSMVNDMEVKLQNVLKDSIDDFTGKIYSLALVLIGCFAIYHVSTKLGRTLYNGLKIAISVMGKASSKALINFLDRGLKPQADLGNMSFTADAISVMIGFFLLDKFDVKNCIKVLTNEKGRENMIKSYTSLSNLFSFAFDKLKSYLTGSPSMYAYSVNDEDVSEWLSNVKECRINSMLKRFPTNRANYELLNSLIVQGLRLKYKYGSAPRDMDSVKNVIRMANMDLDEVMKTFNKSSFDKSSIRIKPLTIVLKGKSGVGKSALTIPLLDNILMRTMKTNVELEAFRSNNMDFIYSRAPETEYWDGYYGQKAVVIDDFMQADELRANNALSNEAFELIRMSNTYPMLLHKAHLEDKGNSYMMSRVILCSTNNFDLRSQVIHEHEALTRRFDVSAIVYPRPKYCVDPNATLSNRRLKKLDEFNSDVYEIHVELKSENVIMDYKEFCDYCVDKYNDLERQGDSYLSVVGDMRDEVFFDAKSSLEPQGIMGSETLLQSACRKLNVPYSEVHVGNLFKDFPLIERVCESFGVNKREFRKDRDLAEAVLLHHNFLLGSHSIDHKTVNDIYVCCNKYFKDHFNKNPFPYENDDMDIQLYEDTKLRKFMAQSDVVESDIESQWSQSLSEVSNGSSMVSLIIARFEFLSNKLAEVKVSVSKKVKDCLSKYTILPVVGLVLTLVGTSYTIYDLVNSAHDDEPMDPQAYSSVKNIVKVQPKSLQKVIVNMNQQAEEVDQRVHNNFMSIARRNMYSIIIGPKHVSYCIFIGGRSLIMNKHIYDFIMKKQADIILLPLVSVIANSNSGAVSLPYEVFSNFVKKDPSTVSDVVRVECDNSVREHRDITDCFVTADELKVLGNTVSVTVFVPDRDQGSVCAYSAPATCQKVSYSAFNEMSAYVYPVPTRVGDCGSVSIISDPSCGYGKILSFHGAGGHGMGCGVTVPSSVLMREIKAQADFDEACDDDMLLGHKVFTILDKPVHIARNTKLRKSLLHGWNGCSGKLPAALKPVDGVDPFDLCLERYATADVPVNGKMLLVAANNYSNLLLSLPVKSKAILSFEEAVEGIHDDPYINGIPRGTSAGYPTCLSTTQGKKEIFGHDGPYSFDTPLALQVRDRVYNCLDMIRKGERPIFYYMDALKDELRSVKKVADLKTRMISCCPIELTILTRMYFGSFAAFMMHNKIFSGSAVGINPFSSDWSSLASYMGGENARCVAGDFTSFDCTQSSDIIKTIVDIINDWYDDGNSNIRDILWREVYNSRHLHNDVVVEFSHGLPSGHPMTSIANSMFVNLAMRICWIEHNHGLLSSIDYFNDAVKIVAYGDDNLCSMSPIAVNVGFDFTSIKQCMASLGLIYTPEDKLSGDYSYKRLTDCTFLKRGFKYNEGLWDAPLDLSTVLEMPNWYRKGPGVIARQVENIDNCLRELAIHGDDVYETYSTVLLNEAYKHRDVLVMSFIPMPIEYYKEKCVASWVDEDSLDFIDFSCHEVPNVSHPRFELVAQADIPVVVGLTHGKMNRPADNIEEGRKSSNSQIESSVTTPVYNSINSTEVARHDSNVATGFLHDAEERTYKPFPIKVINPSGMSFGMDNIDRSSIIKLLQTPVNIRSITLSSATTSNTTIMQIVLPFDSANNGFGTDSGQGMWSQRLNAYQGFKATAVVNFQVNVNRFAQGRLLAHYIPGQNDSVNTNACHRFDLCTKSQNPHVQINLNRDTTTQMRIPYVSCWPCYDLTRNGGTQLMNTANGIMGVLYVVVYSPLVGTTSLPLNVWLHFEDIELFNPTYAPQSDVDGDIYEEFKVLELEAQANLADEETPSGVFSGPMHKISKAAGILSEIPALSSVAGTASWFTRLVSKAAMAIGFSKPDSEARMVRVVNQNNAYLGTGDGELATYKLGLSCSNKLDVLPGFAGNDIDEMSIEYVCNRPAFLAAFEWTSAATQGTSLYGLDAAPGNMSNNYTVAADSNIFTYPPFSAVATMFGNWRADLVFTIKVVKTEFHTGRLSVSFRPGFSSGATAAQQAYLPREILDIKESDTFVVTVPYCSLTPFLSRTKSMGYFSIDVLNPLNAPSSVSNTVEVIVELSACNVHFNGPEKLTLSPVTGSNASWIPQGDMEAPREKSVVMSGLNQETGKIFDSSRFVCGEAFVSFKQLLSRFNYSRYSLSGANSQKSLSILPFTLGGANESSGTYSYGPFAGDALSTISSFYAICRGSVRYGFFSRASNDAIISVYTTTSGLTSAPMAFSANNVVSVGGSVPTSKNTNGYSDLVTVSQWGSTHSRQCNTVFTNSSRSLFLGEPSTVVVYNTATSWSTSNLSVARSAGDDYQLGFFIGVPVMYRDSATLNII